MAEVGSTISSCSCCCLKLRLGDTHRGAIEDRSISGDGSRVLNECSSARVRDSRIHWSSGPGSSEFANFGFSMSGKFPASMGSSELRKEGWHRLYVRRIAQFQGAYLRSSLDLFACRYEGIIVEMRLLC